MELKDIVSVAGVGGLHQIVGNRPTGLILETLDASKKRFPTTLSQKVSILEDIAMYTVDGEEKLRDVLVKLDEAVKGGLAIPDKNAGNDEFKAFFEAVLPNYDKERVYVSDIKKLAGWYGVLKDHIDFATLKETEASENNSEEATPAEEKKETKAKVEKKTMAKKDTGAPKVSSKAPVKKTNAPRKTGGGG